MSISTTSTGPTVLAAGNDISFETTVTNQGSVDANGITLSYYRSADNRLYGGDEEVATKTVDVLAVGADFDDSSTITTPASLAPGIYRYYACVNRVATETNLVNNCSDALVSISIGVRPIPDLNLRAAPSASPLAYC